jgi:hypothetical protein
VCISAKMEEKKFHHNSLTFVFKDSQMKKREAYITT